jgi:putative nucleotidyltransferase with HDIG domain
MTNSTLTNLALQEKTRREILHKSDLIPPLPDFVVRLLGLLNKADTEPRHLEQHLQSDQVLVAKMLAMVNSPFYGLNRPITTIKDAVMVLGFRGIRSLVLASSTARFLQQDFACYGHDDKGLWLHAVSVAAGARFLARHCRLGTDASEQLFVAGLLHDIGKMLLVSYLNDALTSRRKSAAATIELENQVIGIDHTEAGALVTAKWNLSTQIQEVIKCHHGGALNSHPKPVAVVRLADAIAHAQGIGYLPGRAPAPEYMPQDLEALALAGAGWDEAKSATTRAMDEAIAALASFRS